MKVKIDTILKNNYSTQDLIEALRLATQIKSIELLEGPPATMQRDQVLCYFRIQFIKGTSKQAIENFKNIFQEAIAERISNTPVSTYIAGNELVFEVPYRSDNTALYFQV